MKPVVYNNSFMAHMILFAYERFLIWRDKGNKGLWLDKVPGVISVRLGEVLYAEIQPVLSVA